MADKPGTTEALARFTCRPVTAAGAVTGAATLTALTDTIAVAIAGRSSEPAAVLRQWLDDEERAEGPAAVWGGEELRAPAQAALLNGTAAHALDWDDAVPSMAMHPGAVLFPAMLAQTARRPQISGRDLVAAYDTGNAVFRAVTETLPDAVHYGRGWHTTSTVGRLAATAAAARLAGLTVEQARVAFGLAASCAAGSLANFGTMTKPLHAGLAARDAVTAVSLAARGWTANNEELEHPKGFFARYGDPVVSAFGGADDRPLAERLTERLGYWAVHWPEDWAVKRYPSCYGTHRAIDAARWLRAEAGFPDPDNVAQIRVAVHTGGLRPLIQHLPRTGLESKFSLPYTVAVTLLRGTVRLADFSDEVLATSRAAPLMNRVEVAEDPKVPGAEVQVTLRDGRRLSHRSDIARGDARDPLTPAEIGDKAREALGAVGWTADEADALIDGLRGAMGAPALDCLQKLLGFGGTA